MEWMIKIANKQWKHQTRLWVRWEGGTWQTIVTWLKFVKIKISFNVSQKKVFTVLQWYIVISNQADILFHLILNASSKIVELIQVNGGEHYICTHGSTHVAISNQFLILLIMILFVIALCFMLYPVVSHLESCESFFYIIVSHIFTFSWACANMCSIYTSHIITVMSPCAASTMQLSSILIIPN